MSLEIKMRGEESTVDEINTVGSNHPPRVSLAGKTGKAMSLLGDSINTPAVMQEERNMGNLLFASLDDLTLKTEDHGTQSHIEFAVQTATPTNNTLEPFNDIDMMMNNEQTNETVVTYTLDAETSNMIFSVDPVETVVQMPACMVAVNPCDVEGIEMVAVEEEEPKPKKNKMGLSLIMPDHEMVEENTALDTPTLENVLDQQVEESNFDLLDFVVNAELPINDPSFMEMLGGETAAAEPGADALFSTLDTSDLFPAQEVEPVASTSKAVPHGKRLLVKKKPAVVQPAKQPKRRGRPPVPVATVTSDHAYAPVASTSSNPPANEDRKYRRMRDLNNVASKRCRQNRKRKNNTMADQKEELMERNGELKARCTQLEDVVKRLKEQFIQKVANPKRQPLDLDALLSQRLSAMESGV